jgi:hypothetical protein
MSRYDIRQLTAALAISGLLHPLAGMAQQGGANPLIQALQYRDNCAELKDRNLITARGACEKAEQIVAGYQGPEGDAAGRLRGEVSLLLDEIRRKDQQMMSTDAAIRKYMAGRRLNTARERLDNWIYPADDPRPKSLDQELKLKEQEVQQLISTADAMAVSQPKKAVDTYKEARRLNIELMPGDGEKRAQASKEERKGPHGAWKLAKVVIILGALGAGSYYGYQVYKKEKTR